MRRIKARSDHDGRVKRTADSDGGSAWRYNVLKRTVYRNNPYRTGTGTGIFHVPPRFSILLFCFVTWTIVHLGLVQWWFLWAPVSVAVNDSDNGSDNGSDSDNTNDPYAAVGCLEGRLPSFFVIPGTTKPTRVLNVGMPKSGSSSAHFLFQQAGYSSSHWKCSKTILDRLLRRKVKHCGRCIQHAVEKGQHIFDSCGNFDAYTQMDYAMKKSRGNDDDEYQYDDHNENDDHNDNDDADHNDDQNDNDQTYCIFPQITLLKELHRDAPNATWIMPVRNVSHWVRSITSWKIQADNGGSLSMRERFGYCDFTAAGLDFNGPALSRASTSSSSSMSSSSLVPEAQLKQLYCDHIVQVRRFVASHPSLTLLEFNLEHPNATETGLFLQRHLPFVQATDWGHHNQRNYSSPLVPAPPDTEDSPTAHVQ